MDNTMKTILIFSLIATIQGRDSKVNEFYKNLSAQSSGNYERFVEYSENFRRMYSAFPSIELLKDVVDKMEDFSYGVGTSTITCGDAGQGKWTSCLDALDTELVSINAKATEITLANVNNELLDYRSKALQLLADYRAYEKIATEEEKMNFSVNVGDLIKIVEISDTNSMACAIEFVFNGEQDIQLPYRVFDFFTDKSDKTSMSTEQLYDLLNSISDTAKVPFESGLTRKAYEDRILKHKNEISTLKNKMSRYSSYCDKSNRWLNTYQIKWKFIKEWYDYDNEFFTGLKLSTYQAKISDQKISMDDVFSSLHPDASLNEVMAVNQLVPYILDGFVNKLALYAHKISAHLMKLFKTRLHSSTGISNVRLPNQDLQPLNSFYTNVLNVFEITLNLYLECGLNPGNSINHVKELRENLVMYFQLKDEASQIQKIDDLKVIMRSHYGISEEDLNKLDLWEMTYEESAKTFDLATSKFMDLMEILNNHCHLNRKRNVKK